jgi:serine/threonine protein kinase/Flp pilus assembly protein TadD
MTERSVFIAALEIQDTGERSAYLDEVCQGNARLRERVGALLRAHADANGFMEQPATELAIVGDPLNGEATRELPSHDFDSASPLGMRIDRYRLLERIGDGGFGIVYLAEQIEPVRRKVAVKIIKPGMDTREVIARFEAERQALALMDHPNIARVLDAGATADAGLPYFVMELVTGVPITEYCDLNLATTRERLTLFTAICRAVQHAHQKGVIHRDLKPSNILVTLQDGRPVPKVIDFGVAKALKREHSERTLDTACGQLVGTPAYMSPEQAQLGAVDVDTRSDIYALGILLYELLTGQTPLDPGRLRASKYEDLLRIIRDEEPLRPSLRLAALSAAEQELVARQRGTDPQRLQRAVDGDLDWIAMKALEKDRTRRFETAGALARDVERFLQGEAIEARPASQLYQFQKFVRRHQRKFYLATAAVALLALASVGLAVSNFKIRAERDLAEEARELADARATENAQLVANLQTASALVAQAQIFEDWLEWDAADRALSRAIELLPESAAARRERGMLNAELGLWELAAEDLAIAVEAQEPDTTTDWLSHALLCRHVGNSEAYHRACERMHEFFDGTNHRIFTMDVVRACTIGPDAHGDPARIVESAQAVVEVQSRVPEFLYALGVAHYRAGQYESAIERLNEAAAIELGWRSRPITGPVLAMAYHALGRDDEARRAFDDASAALDNWTRARYEALPELWVILAGGTAHWPVPWQDYLLCELQLREARQMLGLPAPAPDARSHVLRGRAFAGLRKDELASAEFEKALAIWPDDANLRSLAHYVRARYHVDAEQWSEAAREFALAGELQPHEPYLMHFEAVSHLAAGDVDSYRRTCLGMLERFADTQDPRAAHSVVELCTVTPQSVPDPSALLPLAQKASAWYPGASRFHGAALYRCGEYQAAIEQLREADARHRATASDLFYLCMAQFHRGDVDAARQTLDSAITWIEQADRAKSNDLRGTQPGLERWYQRVTFPLLRREAEALMTGDAPSAE